MTIRTPFVLAGFLVGCGPSVEIPEQRYAGELTSRCAGGRIISADPDFELVLRTYDDTQFETNIPVCEPHATRVAPGVLELDESECDYGVGDDRVGYHRLLEGELLIEGDEVGMTYRWTGSNTGDEDNICEVDALLMRVD